MAENSKIQWTHHTFNPWRGCTKVSPGCAHCYAEAMSVRNPSVLGVWGDDGTRVVAAESYWRQPLRWDREAKAAGERRRVFCASLADWLEARPELIVPRARLLRLVHLTPHLDWLLLTKRIGGWDARMGEVAECAGNPDRDVADGAELARQWLYGSAMPNVWLGASVEDQARADERIHALLNIPAAVRFLSCEPLLGPVDLDLDPKLAPSDVLSRQCWPLDNVNGPRVDWVIVGGESGHDSRPCKVEWMRSLVRQCRAAGVAAFVKQLGANYADESNGVCGKATKWPLDVLPGGPTRRLSDHKGGDPDEWPEDLRVREFPNAHR